MSAENKTDKQLEAELLNRLDPGIREAARILRQNGIETTESCEGMPGHCYPEPPVCFDGTYEAGFRALALCYTYRLPVSKLLRVWSIDEGEPRGPEWQLIFFHREGGGLHPIDRGDGYFEFQWGPVIENKPAPIE